MKKKNKSDAGIEFEVENILDNLSGEHGDTTSVGAGSDYYDDAKEKFLYLIRSLVGK